MLSLKNIILVVVAMVMLSFIPTENYAQVILDGREFRLGSPAGDLTYQRGAGRAPRMQGLVVSKVNPNSKNNSFKLLAVKKRRIFLIQNQGNGKYLQVTSNNKVDLGAKNNSANQHWEVKGVGAKKTIKSVSTGQYLNFEKIRGGTRVVVNSSAAKWEFKKLKSGKPSAPKPGKPVNAKDYVEISLNYKRIGGGSDKENVKMSKNKIQEISETNGERITEEVFEQLNNVSDLVALTGPVGAIIDGIIKVATKLGEAVMKIVFEVRENNSMSLSVWNAAPGTTLKINNVVDTQKKKLENRQDKIISESGDLIKLSTAVGERADCTDSEIGGIITGLYPKGGKGIQCRFDYEIGDNGRKYPFSLSISNKLGKENGTYMIPNTFPPIMVIKGTQASMEGTLQGKYKLRLEVEPDDEKPKVEHVKLMVIKN